MQQGQRFRDGLLTDFGYTNDIIYRCDRAWPFIWPPFDVNEEIDRIAGTTPQACRKRMPLTYATIGVTSAEYEYDALALSIRMRGAEYDGDGDEIRSYGYKPPS